MVNLKFRAWDKEKHSFSFSKDWNTYVFGDIFECDERLPVGQFTGLVDKNGVDIYSGDIVLGKYNDENDDSEWVVEWNDSKAGWSPFCEYQEGVCSADDVRFDTKNCLVVGNVHQNRITL